ncbi:MAG: dihydropteroate synthase [Bacteroidales bacterium]|nr:dihydropteroate synthase [Bacteroidales bacterium]
MGILNLTPDSFYDGGRYTLEEDVIQRVNTMFLQGADIIDIGGMSTRPGAAFISKDEELKRLLPALKILRKEFPEAVLSVDTFRSQVTREVVHAGADIINDISGGMQDAEMISTIADLQVPYIMMHMQGTPETMQKNPEYRDVVKDIGMFFARQIEKMKTMGINDIILDPGFGFGKNLDHNYQLLNELEYFNMFELPVLVGVSRKSMINKLLGIKPEEALNGTTILNVLALERGVDILRVHDVKEARQAVTIMEKLKYITKY